MATSSLYKTFYIDSKKEANTFVKMLVDSVKKPLKARQNIETGTLSNSEWNKLIDVTLSEKK